MKLLARVKPFAPVQKMQLFTHIPYSTFLEMIASKKRARPVDCDPVLCPMCYEPFRAPPAETAPRRLPCAHCVCAACLNAWALCDEPGCPVCAKPFASHVLDVALAQHAEEVYAAANAADAPAPAPADWKVASGAGEALAVVLQAVGDEKGAGIVRAAGSGYAAAIDAAAKDTRHGDSMQEFQQCVEGMVCSFGTAQDMLATSAEAVRGEDVSMLRASVASAAAGFRAEVAALHAALDASSREVLSQLHAEEAARLKALHAVADEMTVSSGQLGASAALATAALASGSGSRLLEAVASMAATERLTLPRTAHLISLDAPVLAPLGGVATALAALARTQVRARVLFVLTSVERR